MKRKTALIASLLAGSALIFTAQAAPPEGKGPGQNAGQSGKGAGGNSGMGSSGNAGKGNGAGKGGGQGQGKPASGGVGAGGYDDGRRYDDRGRYYDYFDGYRDRHHHRGDDAFSDLIYAGITAALAREYALDFGLGGYTSLPPGIRKNLYRGKPLPPGIAKKVAPASLLGRLPRYSGYEWRIAGTDLILVALGSMLVADILYDVFD